jgi:ABC-type microcin C transport system permease subunit YejE
VAFAVAPEGAGRVIAFGNSRFLTNGFLDSPDAGPANMDLGLNAVNWLVGREEAIDVRPRAVYENRVDLLKGELATIAIYVLGVMPLAGALLGLMVWLVRRR